MAHTEQLLTLYCSRARPIMLPFMTPNSCIAATRVSIDCLQALGIPAEPLATKFAVTVPAINKLYGCGLTAEERAGALDSKEIWGNGWNGHLVVRSGDWLIDPSFDQADVALEGRLKVSGVQMFPLPAGTTDKFHVTYHGFFDSGLRGKIEYVVIDDCSWRESDAWNDEGLILLTATILARMKGKG